MEEKQIEKKAEDRIIRLLSKDIEGKMTVYSGLTKIKGISWSMANAICNVLGIEKKRKLGSLDEKELDRIKNFTKEQKIPSFLFNRKFDPETGENRHLIGNELELRNDFDIKKMKKIKSYKGARHVSGQPVRGQRTKAHFRQHKGKSSAKKSRGAVNEKKA